MSHICQLLFTLFIIFLALCQAQETDDGLQTDTIESDTISKSEEEIHNHEHNHEHNQEHNYGLDENDNYDMDEHNQEHNQEHNHEHNQEPNHEHNHEPNHEPNHEHNQEPVQEYIDPYADYDPNDDEVIDDEFPDNYIPDPVQPIHDNYGFDQHNINTQDDNYGLDENDNYDMNEPDNYGLGEHDNYDLDEHDNYDMDDRDNYEMDERDNYDLDDRNIMDTKDNNMFDDDDDIFDENNEQTETGSFFDNIREKMTTNTHYLINEVQNFVANLTLTNNKISDVNDGTDVKSNDEYMQLYKQCTQKLNKLEKRLSASSIVDINMNSRIANTFLFVLMDIIICMICYPRKSFIFILLWMLLWASLSCISYVVNRHSSLFIVLAVNAVFPLVVKM